MAILTSFDDVLNKPKNSVPKNVCKLMSLGFVFSFSFF